MGNESSNPGGTISAGDSSKQSKLTPRRDAKRSDPAENKKSSGPPVQTLAEVLSLSAYQQQLLLQSWPKVCQSYSDPVLPFQSLNQRNPASKTLFQKATIVDSFATQADGTKRKTDLKEHGKLLSELLEFAVKHLQRSATQTTDRCVEIGQAHVGLNGKGMTGRMWEDLGDCLIEFVCRAPEVRKKREVSKAWAGLVSYLVDNMKNGFQAQVRKGISATYSPCHPRPAEHGDDIRLDNP